MSNLEISSSFSLHHDSSDFQSRNSDVFENLNNLEAKHNAVVKAREDNKSHHNEDEMLMKSDPSEEEEFDTVASNFKKPTDIQGKRHRKRHLDDKKSTPDYLTCPEKWKRYTLSDVTSDQMSPASNSSAAFAFLEERRQNREKQIEDEKMTETEVKNLACSKGLLTFKKPVNCSKLEPKLEKVVKSSITVSSSAQGEHKEEGVTSGEPSVEPSDIISQSAEQQEEHHENETVKTEFKSRKSSTKRQIRKREEYQENSD